MNSYPCTITNQDGFSLVEMLVALAVSSIIIAATFASFELIQKQYKKNIDVAELHTSGRGIMSILEREIRMAGYEFRDNKGLMTYGKISSPLVIIDSGNKCCDEVTIIYDEVFDTLNASGVVTSSTVDRVQTRFWTEPYNSNKRGSRNRLYKRKTILGTNNALLATPRVGAKEVMADYIDDLQIVNIVTAVALYVGTGSTYVEVVDPVSKTIVGTIGGFGNRTNVGMAYGDGLLYVGTSSNYVEVVNPVSKTIVGTNSGFGNRTNVGMAYGAGLLYVGTSSNYVEIVDPVRKKIVGKIGGFGNRTNSGMTFKIKKSGTTSVVSIDMTLRTKEKYGKSRQFLKKDYFNGNFNLIKNDQYFRDTLSTTVSVRNL